MGDKILMVQNIIEEFIDKCNFTFTDEMEEELFDKVNEVEDLSEVQVTIEDKVVYLLNSDTVIAKSDSYEIDDDFIDSY